MGRLHPGGGVVEGGGFAAVNALNRPVVQTNGSGADLDAVVVPVVATHRVGEQKVLRGAAIRMVGTRLTGGAGVAQGELEIRASGHPHRPGEGHLEVDSFAESVGVAARCRARHHLRDPEDAQGALSLVVDFDDHDVGQLHVVTLRILGGQKVVEDALAGVGVVVLQRLNGQ